MLRASIVIPTYNRRDLLLRTLASLEVQTVAASRYEVLVGIDGATDGTAEVMERLRTPYRLRWIWGENAGPAAATNNAARLGNDEVLIFLDDDQISSPELVEAHLDTHAEHGDVFVQGLYPMAPGYRRGGASILYERSLLASLAPTDREHPVSPHVWSANMSVRRSAFERVGGFDTSFREYGGEDTDFGLRVHALGVPFIFQPRAYSEHMHVISRGSFRRQAYSEGRSMSRLSAKFGRPVEEFMGGSMDGAMDRVVSGLWGRSPTLGNGLGRALGLSLAVADTIRLESLQALTARLIHRYYKIGGVTAEARSPAPDPAPQRSARIDSRAS